MFNSPFNIDDFNKALQLAYQQCLDGIPLVSTPIEQLADDYLQNNNNVDAAINSLINFKYIKSFTTGFMTNLGGVVTMPVAITSDLVSSIYISLRMAATIAYLRGYDIYSDQVKTFCYVILCGASVANTVLKEAGVTLGTKLAMQIIKSIPGKIITQINKDVGFRLLTKFGQTGIINLGKDIPFIAGFIGGSFNLYFIYSSAKAANKLFT